MTTVAKGQPKSQHVAKIQRSLNEILYANLLEDGDFGPSTEKVLQDWQLLHGYEPNGLYTDTTERVLDTYIDKRFLKEKDFADAAFELGCPIAHIKAVTKVESRGEGFLASGRNVILFERHIFFRELNKILAKEPETLKALAERLKVGGGDLLTSVKIRLAQDQPSIYNPKTGGYEGTVNGVEREYERYLKAEDINPRAAALSVSYGMFQIMGFNYHLMAGYATVEDMVENFAESERNQLMGFCKFVKSSPGLLKAIRTGDWLTFALQYNGKAQKGYDIKLAAAVKTFL